MNDEQRSIPSKEAELTVKNLVPEALDFDKDGNILRIEVLDASQQTESPFQFEYEVVAGE